MFEVVLAKAHEWIELAKSKCNRYPVLQQNCVLMNEKVWIMVDSCFRLVGSSEKCLQSLFRLLLAGSECGTSFAKFLLI